MKDEKPTNHTRPFSQPVVVKEPEPVTEDAVPVTNVPPVNEDGFNVA